MTEQPDVDLDHDDEFVDLGEASLQTEGQVGGPLEFMPIATSLGG